MSFIVLIPLCFLRGGWWLVHSLFFLFFLVFSYFMGWDNLSYIFGCDCISYGLILLKFWICVLMIMARESILRPLL
jgi:hypothetical protein